MPDPHPGQLVLVDAGDLAALREQVARLERRIDGATITPAPEWVPVPEAARRLHVSPQTVHRWIREGRIEAKGAGKARRVRVTRDGS